MRLRSRLAKNWFPVAVVNIFVDGAKKENLWVKNGVVLAKGGVIHT
jgi:hypothetical protein